MLSTYVRVPHGADPSDAAMEAILWRAQTKYVFLKRPLDMKITPTTQGHAQLATILGLEPDSGHDVYRVDSETEPCPHT